MGPVNWILQKDHVGQKHFRQNKTNYISNCLPLSFLHKHHIKCFVEIVSVTNSTYIIRSLNLTLTFNFNETTKSTKAQIKAHSRLKREI